VKAEAEKLCPNDQNPVNPGYTVCATCADRLWQELHWLADVYDHLFEALTHRLNVERAEQVSVSGGKDPMVRGLDLQEEAVVLRAGIRAVCRWGVGWAQRRGLSCRLPDTEISRALRWLARNLHWVLSDPDPEETSYWAARVVWSRQQAEHLLTPQAHEARKFGVPGRVCGVAVERLDGTTASCGGGVHVWASDPGQGVCDQNPAHLVPRETLLKERVRVVNKQGTKALLEAILQKRGGTP
jgi:hypothetical protein